uniref:Secreted protein n=1 Tax=Ascaris lumbricoides TaxID=6252 RepID=A0A0M3HKL0_ASCLU
MMCWRWLQIWTMHRGESTVNRCILTRRTLHRYSESTVNDKSKCSNSFSRTSTTNK